MPPAESHVFTEGKSIPGDTPFLGTLAVYILGPFSSMEEKIPEEHHEFLHSPQITTEALHVIVISFYFLLRWKLL